MLVGLTRVITENKVSYGNVADECDIYFYNMLRRLIGS